MSVLQAVADTIYNIFVASGKFTPIHLLAILVCIAVTIRLLLWLKSLFTGKGEANQKKTKGCWSFHFKVRGLELDIGPPTQQRPESPSCPDSDPPIDEDSSAQRARRKLYSRKGTATKTTTETHVKPKE